MKFVENSETGRVYGKTLVGYHFIDGKEEESSSNERFKALNASDNNDVVGTFPVAGEKEIEKAVAAAHKAFTKWSQTPAPIRGEIIGRLGQLLSENKEYL